MVAAEVFVYFLNRQTIYSVGAADLVVSTATMCRRKHVLE